jgi:hypothetical protein
MASDVKQVFQGSSTALEMRKAAGFQRLLKG